MLLKEPQIFLPTSPIVEFLGRLDSMHNLVLRLQLVVDMVVLLLRFLISFSMMLMVILKCSLEHFCYTHPILVVAVLASS